MTKTEIRGAARMLRLCADQLRVGGGQHLWYAELRVLARKLDAHARTLPSAKGQR